MHTRQRLSGDGSGQLQSSLQSSGSENKMEERITATKEQGKLLLIAAGRGEEEEVKRILENRKVDVNFPGENGNSPLHYAVKNRRLEVVKQLLNEEKVDVIAENDENIIPLEIARADTQSQDIIDVLVEKIIDHSFEVLKESSYKDKPRCESTHTELTEVEQKIKQIEDKIESCLEFLKKINSDEQDEDISYQQAIIFIYFIETFALEGDPDTKNEVKKYFSQYYTERDRKVFSEVRTQLLKKDTKKLRLKDVRKFISGDDVKSFFKKLEDYVQYVQHVKVLMRVLKDTASELRRPGNEEDVKSFLIKNIKKCEKLPEDFKTKMKENGMLDFIAQFYPAFQKTNQKTFKKFENGDVDSFFIELQEYAQYVQQVRELESLLSKKDENKSRNLLMDEYTEIKKSNLKSDITQKEVFDFVLNYYLAFNKSCHSHTLEAFHAKVEKYLQREHLSERHAEQLESLLEDLKTRNDTKLVEPFLKEKIKASLISDTKGKPLPVLQKLEKCVQRIQQEYFFLKTLGDGNRSTGELPDMESCDGSYVREEFQKLVDISYTEKEITQDILFDFILNFYPAFKKETKARFKELGSLRNNLIHDFHKYGAIEFRKEISRLKHTFFKYDYARQVIEVLCAVKPDEDSKIISKTFKKKLKLFKNTYKSVIEKKYVVSTDEAEDFFGYKISQLLFPEKAGNSQTLVDQYLQFMVIIDCDNAKYCAGNKQDTPIDDEQDVNPESRKELTASARREIFEEFGRLREIYQPSDRERKDYIEEKKKLKNKLKEYGVQSNHFDEICISYVEKKRSLYNCSEDSKKISNIIKSLKRIMDNEKLTSRKVILLYDHVSKYTTNPGTDYPDISPKLKDIPLDDEMHVPFKTEKLSIICRKVVSNMLNTFYITYHTYAIEFNIEEIFNDETFLDFLVENVTEDIDVEELVDQYFFIFMIYADREEISELSSEKELKNEAREREKDMFDKFNRLKTLKKYVKDTVYNREKQKFKEELVGSDAVKGTRFERVWKLCADYDPNVQKERDKVKKIISDVKNMLSCLKKSDNSNSKNMASEYQKLVQIVAEEKKESNEKQKNYSECEKCYRELLGRQVDITLGDTLVSIRTETVLSSVLEILSDISVENETEDIDVEKLVAPYFFIFMIYADRGEILELSSDKELKQEAIGMFDKLNGLETLKEDVDDTVYNEKKQKFKEELTDDDLDKGNRFEEVWKLFVNYDPYVQKERDEVEKIICDVKNVLRCLKKFYNSNTEMASAYQKLVKNVAEEEKELNERDGNYLKCLKCYRELQLTRQVDITLGDTLVSIRTETVVSSVFETFKKTVQLKRDKVHYCYMIIKKLINVDYTAPYIVRLITRVKSDEIIEKDDLVKLVKILLMKEEGLYIKPLNELLKMNSTKLNLFEEVCNKISEPSFSIDSTRPIFKETQYLEETFDVLIERIELEDQSYDEMVKLAIKVLEILNKFDRRLTFPKLEDALKIYNHGLKLIDVIKPPSKKPNSERPIENNESNDSMTAAKYNILLKKAIVIYQQGEVLEKKQIFDQAKEKNQQRIEFEEKQSPEVIKKYEEALKIFLEIANTVSPQSLIALSREAHTRFLLKQYYQAYEKWGELYKKIVNLVRHSNESTASNNEDIYTEIENSDNYIDVRVSSGKNSEYLDILTIRNGMARALLFHGFHRMDENCEKALEIYKEVYSYTKRNERIKPQNNYLTARSMGYMARAHVKISKLIDKQNKQNKQNEFNPNAVKHTEYALIQNVRKLKIQKEWYGDYHPAVKKTLGFIVSNLRFIGERTVLLGDREKVGKRKQLLYQIAKKIFSEIPEHIKYYRDESDELCSKIKTALTSVNEKLDNLARGRPSHGGMQSSTTLDWRGTGTSLSRPTSGLFQNFNPFKYSH